MPRFELVRVLLAPVAIAACLLAPSGCEESGPAVDPATISTDPPAGAQILPREVSPAMVLSAMASGVDYTGHWIGDTRWDGEVIKVKESRGIKTFSVKMHSATTIGGEFWVICEAPVADDNARAVEEGGLAYFKGRIKEIEMDPDPIKGRKIHLDHVKIVKFQKAG